MPRELITIQVGQCGNQIGMKFWDIALQEHAEHNKSKIYDDSMSSFFKNVSLTKQGSHQLQVGDEIQHLKARALIVDMEEGVINTMKKDKLGELFDEKQFISDVSGAGNNWGQGFYEYGKQYRGSILEKLRKMTEDCDSLQCFFIMHSIGGGTGSGLGSYIIEQLADEYPDVFRFTASVFPQKENDHVIVSPYNSMLSLNKLYQHADCVFPIDNEALLNIVKKIPQSNNQETKKEKPFDKENSLIAHLISNITCSMRFNGILDVDLNEITMNLVPYPKLHFLLSSVTPLYSIYDPKMQPRRFDEMFNDCCLQEYQLINCNPCAKPHKYLAVGLILRGKVSFSDVNRNIKQLRNKLDMIYWNQEGFKYGICNQPPINQPYSLLCLANNTAISDKFEDMVSKFNTLYNKQLYIHHYSKFMDTTEFKIARNNIQELIDGYRSLEIENEQKKAVRLTPLL